MSELQKGFRQDKAPTKAQISAENQSLRSALDSSISILNENITKVAQVVDRVFSIATKSETDIRIINLTKENGIVEDGDIVTLDVVGQLEDGTVLKGTVYIDYNLVIGSKSFPLDFEQRLIGAKKRDHLQFDMAFPEDSNPELAGKNVHFNVFIKSVSRNAKNNSPVIDLLNKLAAEQNLTEENKG